MNWAKEIDDADRAAAALWTLGPEAGAGATIWARVIVDELDRYDNTRRDFGDGVGGQATWERLHGVGMVLVVAVAQVVSFGERVLSLTGDAELARAVRDFSEQVGNASEMRDVAMHLDAYAIGKGHRQISRGRGGRPVRQENVYPSHTWISETIETGTEGATNTIETPEFASLSLGDDAMNLHRACELALPLAAAVERARWRYETRAREKAEALISQYAKEP